MGCDFYTWIETVIEWKDLSENLALYIDKPDFEEYTRRYCWRTENYDPDFEEKPEDELRLEIREFGTKVLFEKGNWLCKEAGKNRILYLLEQQKIPLENLVSVYKRMDGYWR
jgi:hypothetical protein